MGKYTEYKLNRQQTADSQTKYRQYREQQNTKNAVNYIVDQLESYSKSTSDFVNKYNNRFFDDKGNYITDKFRPDTGTELLFASKQKDTLDQQRKELINLLDSYGSNFKEDWLKETKKYLNDAGSVYENIIKSYSNDNDLFSQFENADEFDKWLTQQKKDEELRKTDLNYTKNQITVLELDFERMQNLRNKENELSSKLSTKEYALKEQNRRADLTVDPKLKKEVETLRAELDATKAEYAQLSTTLGNADDIASRLNSLRDTYEQAKEFQETEALTTEALNAPDFKEFAQKGSEWGADTNFEIYGKDEGRGTYGFFNREKNDLISYYRNNLSSYENEAENMANGPTKEMEKAYHFAKEMTKDEYNIYAYYLGKGDTDSAQKYLDSIEQSITYRFAENFYEQNLKDANIFEQIVFGLSAGTEQFQTGLENLISDETEFDSSYRQLISGKVQEDLKDSTFGKVAYDLSVTTGNMLPSIITSAVVGYINPVAGQIVGSTLMGASAKGNAYAEMINLGYTKEQASNYSTLVGASEAGLQYMLGGIGKLGGSVSSKAISSAVSKIDNVFARTAIQLGGSMLSEGAEEYLQEVLDPFFKNIAFGEDNDIRFISEEALYSGLLGALSAGVLEGGSVISSNVNTYKTGKQLKAAGVTAEQLSELGSKLSVDSEAYKLAGRINEETGAYTIGRMFNELNTEITAQNKAEIKEALRAKGINPVSANSIANWMERVVAGEELTAKQKAALENNPVLGEVMRDVLYERNTTALQRQAGLDSIRSQLEEYQIKQALDKAVKKAEKKKAKNTANNTANTQDTQNTAQQAEIEDFEAETDTSLAENEKASEANPRVSDNGRTFNTKTGEDLNIVGIASAKDKTFKTADGQTVDSKDVSFATENEAVLFDSVLSMDLPTEIANAIIDGYIPSDNISVTDYLLGSNLAYRYGYAGAKDIELMLDSDVRNIPEHLSKGLYNLGRETAKAEISKEQAEIDEKKAQKSENKAKKKGSVTFDGKELSKEFEDSLTDIQRESIKGIKVIAEVLGNDVNLFASYEAKEGSYKGKRVYKDSNGNIKLAPNGFYNPDGSINLDINSGNLGEGTILYTLSHELTHHIRKWSPAKFKVLADFVVEQYSDNGIKINDLVYEQMAKAKKNGRSISYGTAYEEVIADACSTMLLDSNAIEKLAQKDKTLFEKIKSFIKDFIDKINKLYKNFSPDAKEAQYVKDIKGMTDKLQALWFEGLEDAGESYKKSTETAENESHSSFRNEDEVIELAVDSELADRLEKSKKSKYTIIKDYLVEKFYGQKFKLSDGIEAIMDKSDAQELSHKADMKKTAALSNLRDIIEKAHFLGKADKVNHKKFDAFRYYSIKVSFEGEVYDILLNVGHLKYQDEYHIYDITKKGETANQSSTGLSQPVGDAIKNSFSNSSLPQNSESSQGKFSLRESVEETKDLVAVHNLSEEKLLKSLQLGGLPMPSIAIIRAKESHENFGTISLVFGKETIDPQFFRSNKVYSGDAWTPTYPRVDYKINDKAQEKIRNKINKLVPSEVQTTLGLPYLDSDNLTNAMDRHGGNMVTAYKTNYTMKYAYLLDKGNNIELPMTEKELSRFGQHSNKEIIKVAESVSKEDLLKALNGSVDEAYTVEPAIRQAVSEAVKERHPNNPPWLEMLLPKEELPLSELNSYAQEALDYLREGLQQTVDYKAATQMIDERVDQGEYEKWIKELFSDIVAKEGIRNNKDIFTPSGNRRSFEALHYEHNLENVIKAMKEEGSKGVGAFGGGNIFGASTTEISSIADIKNSAEKRLRSLPDEEFSEIKKGFADRFFELASSLPNNKDSFTATDDAANVLVEAISKYKTKSGIANYIRRECQGWATYSDYVVDDLIELVSDIQQMPTKYFEAKPQRAVGFDEVKAVIIPDNSSAELKSALKSKSFNVLEYQSGNEQDRAAVLNSIEDVKFSDRDSDGNTLSKEQQEFFKDSKVRDTDGNLLVMYHGTPNAGFTKFKSGTYFTQHKWYADRYQSQGASSLGVKKTADNPDTYAVYLNIKKPFDTRNKTERDIFYNEYYRQWGTGTDLMESGLPDWMDGMDLQEFLEENGYDYDGLILDEGGVGGYGEEVKSRGLSYVTFSSEQVKNIDNKAPTPDPDIRFSDRSFSEQIDDVLEGADTTSTHLKVMDTPSILQEAGLPDLPILMTAKHLKSITASSGKEKVNYHGLDVDIVKKLPKYISEPVLIADSLTREDSIVVITEAVDSKKRPVLAAILLDGTGRLDSKHINANIMTSAYGRNNFNSFLERIADNDAVIYWNKKKSQALSVSLGLQLPNAITSLNSDTIIRKAKAFDKKKIESQQKKLSDTDIRYSERDPDGGFSNRYLLANALESTAKTAEDKKKLVEYKAKLGKLSEVQQRLQAVNAKIKEISFGKGKRDTELLKNLQKTSKELNDLINRYDKKLFSLESTESLKQVLEREKKAAYKKAAQEGKEALTDYREKAKQREKDIRTKYQESRQKSIEGREKTAMRHKIKKVVSELNNLLLHGSKEKNVKLGLQKAVASALKTINMDTVNADERVAKYDELIAKASDPVVIDSLKESRDRIKKQGDVLSDKLDALRDAYNDIINSNSKKGDIDFPDYYKAEAALVKQKIESVSDLVGDTPIRNMSLEQLNSVYDMYRMVLTTVRNANKVWRAGKLEDLQQNANAVMTELDMLPKLKEERAENFEKMREFAWNEMIPVYAFERLGSNTFKKFFWDTINAQNVFAEDIAEAKTFADAVREKYNYEKWNRSEIHEFKLKEGRTFRVNLEHMMSIYAYSKRDQAVPHMTTGGFFFNDRSTFRKKGGIVKIIKSTEEGYKVDVDVLAEIKKSMPKECIAYVDEMQDYLTKMGEKGNEVSRVIWGIDIFKEKVYFPLKSETDFVFQANQPTQEVSLKNDGMTKETKPNANNPIVLEDFDDIWASHVNRMSQYHAFVIPIDNINKIHNYGTWAGTASVSVSTKIKGRHGKAANEYLTQFIQDLNGGISVKGASNPLMNMFGKFKKTAVAASTSVVVQQPTAILRATAMIDPKYFVGKPNIHMVKQYEQLKKYAPIAIIKEIGGFDAGAGRQATNWLNDDTKQGIDKALQKIDDISMLGAAWGDILGWCTIWDAVKREIKANNKGMDVNSEEFLNLAGKRFTEVIVYTQVYDSTLSRSGYMRSKHDSVKMLTAFMGEPTVSVNMMYNAILQAKRGGKGTVRKAARTIGAVYLSTIAASAAASAIYALRDDDEDESYMEKFAEAWSDKMLGKYGLTGELNPLTQLPAVKDIISIFEGWDVERTDIAVIKDIKDAFDGLFSDNKSTWRKIEDFSGAIASLFGLPVKNILRTGREMYNAVNAIFSDVEGGSFGEAFVRGMTGEEKSKPNKLYDAIVNGDEETLKIFREGYKDDSAYKTAVKKALRENDPRIKEAAEAGYNGDVAERVRIAKEIIAEGNFSQDIVVEAINAEINAIKKGSDTGSASENEEPEIEKKESMYSTSDIATAFESGDTELAKAIIADIVAVKAENYMAEDESLKQKDAEEKAKSSVKGTVTSYWKPLYIEAYNAKNTDEMKRIRFALKDTGLYGTANDIISTCNNWVKESREK